MRGDLCRQRLAPDPIYEAYVSAAGSRTRVKCSSRCDACRAGAAAGHWPCWRYLLRRLTKKVLIRNWRRKRRHRRQLLLQVRLPPCLPSLPAARPARASGGLVLPNLRCVPAPGTSSTHTRRSQLHPVTPVVFVRKSPCMGRPRDSNSAWGAPCTPSLSPSCSGHTPRHHTCDTTGRPTAVTIRSLLAITRPRRWTSILITWPWEQSPCRWFCVCVFFSPRPTPFFVNLNKPAQT
jgi:hypothetical protein